MKLFISGYMGSGKSVISKQISTILDIPFIDLDDQIALIEEQSIHDIFEDKGELYFRKREAQVLQDVLDHDGDVIISLGGGTPCYGNNMEAILATKDAKMIYLKASIDLLTKRLFDEKDTRPVISHLKSKEALEDFIRKHMFERSFYYNQASIIVDVEGKNPKTIATEIVEKLK